MKKNSNILKLISCLLAVLLISSIVPSMALIVSADIYKTYEDFEYRIPTDDEGNEYNEYVEITGYNGNDTEITIPSEIDGYIVKSIAYEAFDNNNLISVTISHGITNIGAYAFYKCDKLLSINIPNSVINIGEYAFEACTSLTSINIPNSVTSIGDGAFEWCEALTNINIPNSVTNIGIGVFDYCTSLTSINVDSNNEYYTSIDGVLFTKDMKNIVCYPTGKNDKSYTIPDSVMSIDDLAFKNCTNLISIDIPDSVTSIGSGAFDFCESLESVNLPKNLKDIGDFAFEMCKSLTNIVIPNGAINIGKCAFKCCTGLVNIEIPSSVTSIGKSAFDYCTSLTSITIPEGITEIIEGTFSYCTSLKSIDIPHSVTSIDNYSFYKCTNLESVTIGNNVTSIGFEAFSNCTNLTSIILPDSVTSIYDDAFYKISNLTIYGYKNSYAETYAKNNDIPFVSLSLTTPKITKAQSTGINSIKLTWSIAAGADGYIIYRSTKQTGGWSRIATVKGESNMTYTDTTAIPNTQYYYTVRAYLTVCDKNYYSSYNKTGFAGKATLTIPKIKNATAIGYNSIKLNWNEIAGADGYYVYRSTTATNGWSRIATISKGTTVTYTDTKAKYNTQYYYTIRAYVKLNDTVYKSGYVTPGTAGKTTAIKPIFTLSSASYNMIRLSWNKVLDADGYIIYRTTKSDNTGWKAIKTITSGTTVSFTDSNLTCGTTYYYTMRSYKTVSGTKIKSGYLRNGIACKPIPSTPKVTATQQKNKTVVISWNKIAGATTYKVYRRVPGGSWSTIKTITDMSILSYKDTPPNTKIQYEYTVKAYHNNIAGKYKAVAMTMYTA